MAEAEGTKRGGRRGASRRKIDLLSADSISADFQQQLNFQNELIKNTAATPEPAPVDDANGSSSPAPTTEEPAKVEPSVNNDASSKALEEKEKELQSVKASLAQAQNRIAELEKEKEREISALKKELEAANAKYSQLEEQKKKQITMLTESVDYTNQKLNQAEAEKKLLKDSLERANRRLKELEESTANASTSDKEPAKPESTTSRWTWGKSSAPETPTIKEDDDAPPPPKRTSANPRASQTASFFSSFLAKSAESISSALSSSTNSLEDSTTTTPTTPTVETAPVRTQQSYLSAVNEAVAAITNHIASGATEEEKAILSDDSKDIRIASLTRGKLASSLAVIFSHEFNPFTLWGTPHFWEFIQAATAETPSVNNLAGLSLTKAVKDISKEPIDNNIKFRNLIAAGLNNNSLDEWIYLLASDEKIVSKFYEKEALLANKIFVNDLAFSLKVLGYYNVKLDENFETTPREKPENPPEPVPYKCSFLRSGKAGEKQPYYFCTTCQLTEEGSAFCAGCLLSNHQSHLTNLTSYANYVCPNQGKN